MVCYTSRQELEMEITCILNLRITNILSTINDSKISFSKHYFYNSAPKK